MGYVSVTKDFSALFRSLVSFGGRYIHPNVDEDNEYTEVCSKHIDGTVKSFFIKMGLMLLSLQGSMIGPGYAYFMYGTKTTMTNVRMPYIDPNSNMEFVANLMLASIIGVHGFIGYIGLEVAMAIFSDAVTIVPKLIILEFERMDTKIEKNGFFSLEFHYIFRNIIKQALDSDEYDNSGLSVTSIQLFKFCFRIYFSYITGIGDLLFYRTLVTPALFTYAIGLTIFCQYNVKYYINNTFGMHSNSN